MPNYKAVKRNKLTGATYNNLDKFLKHNVEKKKRKKSIICTICAA